MITMPMMMAEGRAKEEVWEIIVNTEASTAGAKITGIPISLHNQPGITMTVDWGDGTESVLTQASYTEGDYTPSTHEYATPGTYTVQMTSTKWGKLYIDTASASSTSLAHLQAFRDTLIDVGPLPQVAGTLYLPSSSPSVYSNSLRYIFGACSNITSLSSGLFANNPQISDFSYCFIRCSNLTTIPSGLLANTPKVTNLQSCFSLCPNLTSIPSGLFANNPKVTNFGNCFQNCSSLTSIPEDLFANNTQVTNFSSCFYSCSGLTSIPSGLFANNSEVTSFSSCFNYCSSLTSIPEDLFANNTQVTDLEYCFRFCLLTNFTLSIGSSLISSATDFVTAKSGTTRTIYVPSGSTTETTFNSVAADLGLTIIGE